MAEPQIDSTFVHINEQEVKECREAFQQGGVASCETFLRRKAEEWRTIPLDIGIIGNSGTGKSSFINAIRGLTADDTGAAAVGVNETTTIPTAYAHPNNQLLKFWDLPGVGTPNFPKETYLEKIGFQKFDFFLIMSKDRFTENDQWIAREIAGKEKQFFFIRSKIHSNIKDDKESHPRTHNPEVVLASIREDIREKLGDMYRENGAFLIDNHKRKLYDFDLLEKRISEDLPSLKRAAFILSVSTLSEDMVTKKVEVLRSEIWKTALLSGTIAIVPIPGLSLLVDIGMIVERNKFYFMQLGLDEDSLKQTARVMSCDVAELTQIVEKSKQEFLTWQGIKTCIQGISSLAAAEAVEEFARFVPFLGSLMAGGISAVTTYKILNHVLSKMEQTALLVVRAAVKSSSKLVDEVESDDD